MKTKNALILSLSVAIIAAGILMLVATRPSRGWTEAAPNPSTLVLDDGADRPRPTSGNDQESPSEEALAAYRASQPKEPPQPDRAKIDAFSQWTLRWNKADAAGRQAMIEEGTRLARQRRPEFKALIATNPQEALANSVPRVIRQDLPPEILSELELPVSTRGEYIKFLGLPAPGMPAPERKLAFQTFETSQGKKYNAHVFGQMEPVMWKKEMPLQGVAVDQELAVAENPVRKLEVGERIPEGTIVEETCPVSGQTTVAPSVGEAVTENTPTVEIGERIITLCNGMHVKVLEEQNSAKLQASGPGGANSFVDNFPGTASRAIGNFRCLYIRVNYPDQLYAPNTEDSAYWDLANTTRYYLETSYGKMTTTAVVTPLVTLPQTKAWYYAKDSQVDGLGRIHGDARTEARKIGYDPNQFDCIIVRVAGGPRLDGISWGGGNSVWLSWDGMDVMNHECGHSLGLNHANSWVNSDGTGYGAGGNGEYGNWADVMGGGYGFAAQYNTISKRALGWLTSSSVYDATASGTYRIYAYDQPRLEDGKRYQLSVPKDGGRRYNVEFHQALGGGYANSALLLYSGVGSNAGNIIVASPSTGDWAMKVGRTFSDLEADIHFTVISKNDTSPASLDIVYNRGPFPGNVPPTVSLAANNTTISPGGSVTFTATASDSNGDALAYLWEFDDGGASANTPVFTRTFSNTGQYTAMLTVSDMKGGTTRRNIVINVGSHGLQTVTGNVAWNGQPLQSAKITCGSKYCYTDADGNYSLSGIGTGAQTLSAFLNGYTFTPQFTNPLTVVAGTNTANWTSGNGTNFVSLTKLSDATEGGSPGAFRITRSGDTSADLVVNIAGPGGTATKNTDYTFSPDYDTDSGNYFVLSAGQTTLDVSVPAIDDTVVEGPETIALQLVSNGSYLSNSANSVVINVNDNDTAMPVVSVTSADSTGAEFPADPVSFTFSRTGSTAAALDLFVNWSGAAANGGDYTGLATKVTIPAGQASTTVSVNPINDSEPEPTEDVTASISATPNNWVRLVRSGTTITGYRSNDGVTWTQAGTGTISMNANVLVGLALSSENSATLATAAFDNVSVSGLSGSDIGTASLPGCTAAVSGTYSIRASGGDLYGTADSFHFASTALNGDGEIRARVTAVSTNATWIKAGVMIRETSSADSKNVLMCIGGGSAQYDFQSRSTTAGSTTTAVGPGINTANGSYVCHASAKTATATITDDDPPVFVSVSVPDATASEAGQDSGVFLISRTGSTAAPLKVYYGLSGTALHGTDYQPLTGEVTIPAGATSAPVVITPIDDDLGEPEYETVTLSVTTFNGAYSLGPVSSGTLTIQDNDDVPVISVRPSGFGTEGGSNPSVVFRAIGSAPGNVTVNYTVSGTATPGTDYTALSGSVTLSTNGTNDVAVTIPVIDDATPEPTETVVVKITPGAGYRVYNDGTATTGIYDNDSGDRVRVSGWGDAPSENGAVGRVYFSRGNTAADLTVNYTVSGTATNGVDYNTLSGSVVIPAGSTGADVTITPINDTEVEGTESVTLTVVGGTGYGADIPDSVTLYISDNETPPVTVGFTSSSSSTTEQPGANGQYRDIAVTLSAASSNTVTVDYDSNGGNATGDDVDWAFVDASAGNAVIPRGTLTFPPGTTSQNIRVSIKNDGVAEQTETAAIRLYNARFAGIGTSVHTISITDGVSNQYVVRFATAATSRSESDGTEPLLMAMLDRPCGATPITVNYTVGGTATAGSDYVLSPGTLTFNSGEQMKLLPFTILSDAVSESPETVIVTLTSPTNAVLGSPSTHTITLTDSNPSNSSAWINPAGGSWTNGQNWTYGMVANGTDKTADFSTLDISGTTTVTLNGSRTIGNLVFADPYPSGSWNVNPGSGGSLTLDVTTGTPTITVNNQSVTIGASIGGNEGLQKAGYGTLVLTATNTYTGGTTVMSNGWSNASLVQLDLGNLAGQAILGDLTIGSAGTGTTVVQTTAPNQFSATQTLQFNTNASEGSNWNYFRLLGNNQTVAGLNDFAGTGGVVENMESEVVYNNATLTLAGSGACVFNGYIRDKAGGSGTGLLSLVKTGSGSQTLSGTRISYTGDTTVNQGVLALNNATAFASLNTAVGSSGTLELNNTNAAVDNWTIRTVLTGGGTININNGTSGWVQTYTNAHTFSGTINVLGGTFGTAFLNSNWSGMSATVNVSAGAVLDARGQAITVGALSGAGTVGTTWTSAATVTVGAGDKSGSFSGVIAGNATSGVNTPSNPNGGVLSLNKIGTGTQTLTGNNTYTGSTTVTAGTLNATGTLKGATTVQTGATLSVGTGVIGTLTLTNSLSLAGTTTMEVSKSGSTLSSDSVTGLTSLNYGGALTVTKLGADALTSGNSFTLFTATTYTGNFSSITLPSLSAGLYWDTTQLVTNGTISVQSIQANDADGDGFSDSVEVAAGTNPNNASSQPSQVYSGLRGWWKLNETSGTVTDDSTGLPQDGTLLNSAAWTSGISGNAVSLNGTSQSVQIPALNLNSSYGTITTWVKRNGTQVDWAGIAFERGSEASGLSILANNELRYHWNLNWNYSTGLIVPDNTWTFCALVVQPGKATVYMQPLGGAMQSFVNNLAHGTASFNGTFYLGQDTYSGTRFFKGAIDDVRVYARALSTQELAQVIEEAHPPHVPAFVSNPLSKPAATEGSAYTGQTLAGSASDADAGDTLTFSKVSGPTWLSVASNGALSGTPGTANAGANSFTVRATDSTGLFANATLNISVAFINDAPTWNSNPTTGAGATEDAAYSASLANAVTDSDVVAGDVLSFTKLSGPSWLNVAANGALTGTPGNSNVGMNAFSVRVADTAGQNATATVNITVANANDAPTWTSATITKPAAREATSYTGTLASDASDLDAGDTLTFSKVSGPAWLNVASNGDLSGTPGSGDVGANSFTVRVTDSASASVNATLQITVTPQNSDGTWLKVVGGSWNNATNWSSNTIANGVGKTADFSTLNLTSHATVTLDGSWTIGNLTFGDTSPSRNWFLNPGSGGTLNLDVVTGTPTITVNNQTTTIGVTLGGVEGFAKAGAGTLILTGANTYSGDTVASNGVLGLEHTGAGYPIPGNVSASNVNSVDIYTTQDNQFAPGVALIMTGNSGDHVRLELLGTTQTLAGLDNTGAGGRGVVQHREMVAPAAVDGASLLVINGATGSYYFDGYLRNVGGTIGVTKSGVNTQTFAGGNINYTDPTTVNGGVLEILNAANFASTSTVNSTGTLRLKNTVNMGWGGGAPITLTNGATLEHAGQTNGNDFFTLAGAVTVSGSSTINQASVTNTTGSSKSLFLDGGLKGSGTCTINATNPGNGVVLRNNNSTFAGQLIVNGVANPTVNLGSGIGVGGCTVGLQNADIQVNGTMEMLSQGVGWAGGAPGDFKMGALTGTGAVTANFTGGGQMRLVVGNTNGSGTFSGVIADGAGDQLLFTKIGTGIQTLSGANTYTGSTTVSGGTLRINGSQMNGAVTVANTATLGGTGTVGGAVTVQNGGTLAPGAGAVGTLTINNTLNLTGTTTTTMEVSNTGGTPSSDRVSGISTVTYGGTLVIANAGPDPLIPGTTFTLFSATNRAGSFATITLPSLGSGMFWDTTKLSVNGTISIRGVPVAVNDSATVAEDGSVSIAVLANDSDPDLDTITIQSATQGAHGAVAIVGNNVTYTPASNWNGGDSFSYTITDSHEGTATATVSVSVTPVNDAPVFTSNPIAGAGATEDSAYSSTLAGLASDVDAGDTLTYLKVSGPAWLSVAANGALSGTPVNGDVGANAFTVRVTDAGGLLAEATLNITVTDTNDAPTWNNATITKANATEDVGYSGSVASDASDVDAGDTLTFSKVSGPAWLSVASNGTLSGTPGNSDVGANTFTVRVSDGAGANASATLNITVINVNDAPTWTSGTITKANATENISYSGSLAADASDVDAGDTLTFSKVSGPTWLSVAANGALSGTPAFVNLGLNSFAVRVTDAAGATADATLQITVVATGVWTNAAGGSWPVGTNWSGGAIAAGSNNTADFSTLDLAANATVTLDGARTLGNLLFGDATPSNNWTLNAGSGGTLTLAVSSGPPTINVANQTTTVSAVLTGTQGLLKAGAGTLTLTGANTYTGATTVNGGTLGWSGSTTLGSAVTVNNGGTYSMSGSASVNGGVTAANGGTFTWDTTTRAVDQNPGGKINIGIINVQSGGVLNLINTKTVSYGINDTLFNNQVLQGAGTINQTGGGVVDWWSGTDISGFSGTYNVQNGIVSIQGSTAASAATTAIVNLTTATGYLDLRTQHFACDQLNGGGTVGSSWTGAYTLTVGTNNGSSTFNGVIRNGGIGNQNGSATIALTKTGIGTLTLTGANIYTGATTVNGGTLRVNGSSAASVVTVANNGTLGGTGTIGGVTTVQSGGTLAPGAGGIGILTINNTLSLAGTTQMEVSKNGGVLSADKVSGVSTVTYGGTLIVSNVGPDALVSGNSFTIFSATTRTGSFSSITLPPLASGLAWDITQLAVNGTISVTTLPSGWATGDIGSVGVAGSVSYNAGAGSYTVSGSGSDIGSTADGFQFASQTLVGDGEIRARVASQTNTNASAKAGVMIRDGSAAGAVNALMTITPGNGFAFQSRNTASGSTSSVAGPALNAAPNNWVRLTRSGTLVTAYASADGASWTQVGTATLSMSASVSVGLAVTSHDNSVAGTATFDNVTITAFPTPWLTTDLGTTGLQGSAEYFGSTYTVKGAGVIGGSADGLRYVYQTLSADGSIVARVITLQDTGTNARVGVMIRDNLTNNAPMAALTVNGSGTWTWENRTTSGGSVSSTTSSSGTAPNLWVKLVRSGDTITASSSADGTNWTTIGSASVAMASNCYIGLGVASGSTSTLNSSVMDSVTVVP